MILAFKAQQVMLEAHEQGARVLLIEKMGRPDSTSAYSSGWIAATKTRYQDPNEKDSKEAYFEDIYPETDLFQMYLVAQAESAQWE